MTESSGRSTPTPLRDLGLALYLPSLLVAIGQQAVLIMLPLYALDLGGGPAAAAVVLAMKGFGTVLADLPSGAAVSRFGDKRTMLGGLTITTASVVALGFVEQWWAAAALTLVFGTGVGAWMLTRMHYVAVHCPATHRGRAMTVLAGIQRLGTFIGPALGGLAVKYLGYPTLFLTAGALSLAGIVLVVLFTRPTDAERLTSHHPLESIARVIREHRGVYLRAGSATIALQFIRAGRQLMIPLWGQMIGLDAAAIGLLFGLSSVIDACMFYPAGWVMDFWGRKWTAVPSTLVIAASLGALALTDSFGSYGLVVLLSGFGNGLGTGVVMTIGADFAPANDRGEFLGVWRLIGDLGSAFGPLVLGAATKAFALSGALALCAGVGGVGAVVMIFAIRETLVRRR